MRFCCSLLLSLSLLTCLCKGAASGPKRIAIIGEGVIGLSTATALLELAEQNPSIGPLTIDVYSNLAWNDTLSRGIGGLFRIDKGTNINRVYGNQTFVRLARLFREYGGVSGSQLLSGHILAKDREKLKTQERTYADIVYNFRFLSHREIRLLVKLEDYDIHAIHYSAYTAEGLVYCPFMKSELLKTGKVTFHTRDIKNVDELGKEGFDVVVNCAGLNGGKVAGDGDEKNTYPIRGVLIKVDAPWQKHFLYQDFGTFTIPVIEGVVIGTVKQVGKAELNTTDAEIDEIMKRYQKIQPAMTNVKTISTFVGLRPGRDTVRVEAAMRNAGGKEYKVVHNYGHGGNGFTLGYGSSLHAAHLALGLSTEIYDEAMTKDKNGVVPGEGNASSALLGCSLLSSFLYPLLLLALAVHKYI